MYLTRQNGVYEEQHQLLGIAGRQSLSNLLHLRVGGIDAMTF
jgi:hypothetical protein